VKHLCDGTIPVQVDGGGRLAAWSAALRGCWDKLGRWPSKPTRSSMRRTWPGRTAKHSSACLAARSRALIRLRTRATEHKVARRQELSPCRQASVSIAAGRAVAPSTCWVSRSSSRTGSVDAGGLAGRTSGQGRLPAADAGASTATSTRRRAGLSRTSAQVGGPGIAPGPPDLRTANI
jgi:hypothetical protein